jgi:predicted nicotinamide N-methyase
MKSAHHRVDQADDEAKEECWNLPADFNLYTKHEIKHVYFPRRKCDGDDEDDSSSNVRQSSCFRIECINPSSPLDVSNNGTSSSLYDATGHCVWAGAFLLIQCIYELKNILNEDIGGKRLIEFGCGTGIGGLAMLLANEVDDKNDAPIIPSHVTFTDNDPSALRICDRNCKLNSMSESSYSVSELTWGDEVDTDSALFDFGLATDALYDEKMIIPLFKTVSRCVIPGGVFILSHIPRACFKEGMWQLLIVSSPFKLIQVSAIAIDPRNCVQIVHQKQWKIWKNI